MVFVIVHDRRAFSRPLNALGEKLLSRRVDGKLLQIDGPWNAKLRCSVDDDVVDVATEQLSVL